MTIAINTLEYARLLIDAGVERTQAEAQASVLNNTLKEHVLSKEDVENKVEQAKTNIKEQVATKEGVARSIEVAKNEINARINLLEEKLSSEARLNRWMLGFLIAMMSAIFVKLFVS